MFKINNSVITYDNNNQYIIAELCCNHCGDVELAKKFILAAKESGANAIKFQKRNNKKLFTSAAYNKKYDSKNSFAETYGLHRDILEFNVEQIKELFDYTKSLDIDFIVTPFDIDSFKEIEKNINVDAYKVSSYDFVNLPLIRTILGSGKPVILSTGAQCMKDVTKIYQEAIKINKNICIMQCTSSYPCDLKNANLNVIDTYRKTMKDIIIGYSGHDIDIQGAIVAYCKGALVIEKHFTLDRSLKGTDNVFSLTPPMLKELVDTLEILKPSFGSSVKQKMSLEEKAFLKLSKKMVASKDLAVGHVLTEDDIDIKSPGDGLSAINYDYFIGKPLKKSLKFEENLSFEHVDSSKKIKDINDVIVIIQARTGSSRAPGKMINKFCDTTLTDLAIQKVLKSKIIPRENFYLTVGDPELIEIGNKYGVNIYERSEASVKENSDVKKIYEWHDKLDYKYWIKINACQPLLTIETIDRFVEEFLHSESEGMFSVLKKKNYFWNKEGEMMTPWPEGLNIMNTGVVEHTYEACHSLFAGSKDQLINGVWTGTFQNKSDPELFEITSEIEVSDIDYPQEFKLCEILYQKYLDHQLDL